MRTFSITSIHDVYVDDYNQGELEHVNWYKLQEIVSANDTKEAIQKYFNDYLFYDFDIDHAYIPHIEDESENKNVLHYSVLVDVESCQASSYDVVSWKEGRLKLFSNNINIIIQELIEVEI